MDGTADLGACLGWPVWLLDRIERDVLRAVRPDWL
jgi:hypothetical protein